MNSTSTAISQSKSTETFLLHDTKSKPKASVDDKSVNDKKSIWNWKPLKALSINRSREFNCCFSIRVHLIEGLPLSFNDASLCVYWKRQDGVMVTHPAKVIQCMAEFEEMLTHTCSISGSRSAPHKSAKYEAKHVLLYASMVGAPELDLGKHRVDLMRLLPLTLEELEEEITEPHILPPLPEGFGPFLQTKDGGFLRSMNPSLFRNAKGGGNLIMQVSNPVGIEKLSMQPNKLMPLKDITRKNIQQLTWESIPVLQGTERQCHFQHDLVTVQDATCVQRDSKGTSSELKSIKFSSSSVGNQTGKEFVSLDDLAPLAMDEIEALSMDGLRIQSGMSEEDASSNIIAQSFGEILALQGECVNISWSLALDGAAAALQLLDLKDSSEGVDGIIGLSLTLDEWMRLDSGEFDDDKNSISEHASKVLAAHHANNSFDLIHTSSKGERKQCKGPARKCGLLGNNFTVELMVQLRDPMRNYEPLGTPMLSIVQVEREFVPPKQRIYSSVSEAANSNDGDDECEIVAKVEMKERKKEVEISEEKGIPQFSNTKVHVAGPKTKPHKNKLRGSSSQQQSGSRWLLANGMGKINKHPLMKSKAATW